MLRIASLYKLSTILIIVGSCPDQNENQLLEYLEHALLGREHCETLRVNFVNFGCQDEKLLRILNIVATIGQKVSVHNYFMQDEPFQCQNDDMAILQKELSEARVRLLFVAISFH